MNTNRYTPAEVVKEGLLFSIPLYQRLFTWERIQVEGLLFDLKQHFSTIEDNSPYYLGMLSCISRERYDLIDGQQRFTVMMLMAIVLREYFSEWDNFLDGGNRLHFVARTQDEDFLKSQINKETSSEHNEKMEAGIRCIKEFMESDELFSSDAERKTFAENIYKRMSFFFSELPDSYTRHPASLNKYFEAMNASGKGLEQHEILKVQLMKNQTDKEYLTRIWNIVSDMSRPVFSKDEKETEKDYRSKYERAIKLCRNNRFREVFNLCESSLDSEDNEEIGNIKPSQHTFKHNGYDSGDRSLITFPEFLMMVVDIYKNLNGSYSFYREELINVFRNHEISDIQEFYNQLLFYRLILDYYIVHKEDGDMANKYGILFKGENESDEALKQYQSMLYVSQTPFYNWIKPLLIQIHDEVVNDTQEYLNRIKYIDDELHPLPSDVSLMTYDKGIDRYWFWRLDYYLWEQRDKYFSKEEGEIVDGFVFRTNRSIEHLHPQHQEHNTEWTTDDIHSFGNLAMISQSFNAEQSDDSVMVKFARIKEQADHHALQSIKLYKMYLDANKSPAGWTNELKNNHQMQMYELLKASYNRD